MVNIESIGSLFDSGLLSGWASQPENDDHYL